MIRREISAGSVVSEYNDHLVTNPKILATDHDRIVVHVNGDLTLVGGNAYRLYEVVRHIRFTSTPNLNPNPPYRRLIGGERDTRYLIEHAEPCDDLRPQLEHALRVEAALLGVDLDCPYFTCGPVALRRSDS